jgi:HEAT repeat protein
MPAVLPDPSWSTEKLIAATKDKHMLVRSNAIILLSKREASESLEALIEALKDEEYLVKSNAMVAISAYGKQVSDRVIQALDDADKDVRAGAAWIVGELKDNRAIDALEKVARGDYPLARIQAKASLVAMGKGPKKQAKKEEPEVPEEEPEVAKEEKTE